MDANHQPDITPEQRQAILAGHGAAEFRDPMTAEVFVVEKKVEVSISDEYIQAKLDEARDDIANGRVSAMTTEEVLVEARKRRAKRLDQ